MQARLIEVADVVSKQLGGIDVKLNDFKEIGVMGKGSSGRVVKVRHRPSKMTIALKEINSQTDERI